MRRSGRGAVVLAAVGALALGGCGGGQETEQATTGQGQVRLAEQWAGKVTGTRAYISVFTLNNGQAGAYLADGASIAALVLGKRQGDQLNLGPTEGSELSGRVDGGRVSGTVTLKGAEHRFTAERTRGDAGWYRGRKKVGGQTYAAGFVVLNDGSFRGAARRGKTVVAHPKFDAANLVIQVPGAGRLQVLPVAEFVKREQTLK